jgi:hypothetical protein
VDDFNKLGVVPILGLGLGFLHLGQNIDDLVRFVLTLPFRVSGFGFVHLG